MAEIVAAAILDGARLLAARRSGGAYAGQWELPGGKVEAGESDAVALLRELYEELAVTGAVGGRVGGEWPALPNHVMRVYLFELDPGSRPVCNGAHDEIRWLGPGEWYSVPWIAADLPILGEIRRLVGMLSQDEIDAGAPQGWEGDPTGLRRTLAYRDFAEALAAVNRIGEVAEAMNHHPDIDIRWNKVALTVVSHSAGGVTEADLELARRINEVV